MPSPGRNQGELVGVTFISETVALDKTAESRLNQLYQHRHKSSNALLAKGLNLLRRVLTTKLTREGFQGKWEHFIKSFVKSTTKNTISNSGYQLLAFNIHLRSIRTLTSPQMLKITCSYLWRARRNLSLATLNILIRPIRCSTPIREDNSLFSCFWVR